MDARGARELKDYIAAASGEPPSNPAPIRDASAPPIFAWVGVPAPPRPAVDDVGEEGPPSVRLRISGWLARIRKG